MILNNLLNTKMIIHYIKSLCIWKMGEYEKRH